MSKAVLSRVSAIVAGATVSIAAIALPSPPVAAQPQQMLCGLREDMGRMLAQRFGEQPRAAGLVGDRVVELLVSQTGSFTVLITTPDGRSCVVTGGEDWTDRPVQAARIKDETL